MTLADLIKDIIDTSKERLKNPISGAFLWSYLIYNWRPISVLFFSEAPIEDRIIVINDIYCKPHAIYGPFVLAVFYIIIVPFIMWVFDWPIVYTKKIRRAKSNENKEDILQRKIDISTKVNELKDAESGNKEKQDFLDHIGSLKEQIETQKESIKQINESNKVIIDELNNSLRKANSRSTLRIKDTDQYKFDNLHNTVIGVTIHLDQELANEIIIAVDSLTFDEFHILKVIDVNNAKATFFTKPKDNLLYLDSLTKKKILNYKTSGKNYEVSFTQIGLVITNIIQST